MLARCCKQSWYKYQIRIVARALICRDLVELWSESWSDSHMGWTKGSPVSDTRWTKPMNQTKNLGGNLTRFRNKYRYIPISPTTLL